VLTPDRHRCSAQRRRYSRVSVIGGLQVTLTLCLTESGEAADGETQDFRASGSRYRSRCSLSLGRRTGTSVALTRSLTFSLRERRRLASSQRCREDQARHLLGLVDLDVVPGPDNRNNSEIGNNSWNLLATPLLR
jgi:hypothetical protein